MKKFLAPVLAALLVLLAAACSSTNLSGLGLELTRIERGAGGEVTATVRVTNTNVVAYNFARARHVILLDGREVGTLDIATATGVPAQNAIEQTGVVTLRRDATLPGGTASYQLKSEIEVRLYGERTDTRKLGATGTVAVK
jgi:hypothetical protein